MHFACSERIQNAAKEGKNPAKPFQGIHCVSHLIIVAFETCIVCTHEIKDWKFYGGVLWRSVLPFVLMISVLSALNGE